MIKTDGLYPRCDREVPTIEVYCVYSTNIVTITPKIHFQLGGQCCSKRMVFNHFGELSGITGLLTKL